MQVVSTLAAQLFGKTTVARIFFGGVLLLILILTRWCWIDCDGGTPSLMEYGYFATDEGYYCGGGKQKYLFGKLISFIRAMPNTYAICPATHIFTWISFLIFGQTSWAHRVFPLLLCTVAWFTFYVFLTRKTLAWIAFLLCACCLLNPFLMVYSRTACNDTLMASVLLIGYICARKKGRLSPFAGGCVFGLGLWVKASIWVLFPIGISGALTTPAIKDRGARVLHFIAGFLISACVQYGLIRLLIYPDALAQQVTVDQLLAVSNSSYGLPNPFDWESTFKGVSAFPRFPTGGLLGMWIPLVLVLPALLFLRRLTDKPIRWDGRLLLYLTFPLYAAGLMIMPVYYGHYFIPMIAFLPVLWIEARHDLKLWVGKDRWSTVALMAIALLFTLAYFHSFDISAEKSAMLNDYLANAYNLPRRIVWTANGAYILTAAAFFLVLGLWARQRKPTAWAVIGLLLSALGVADLCFSRLPLSEAFKYTSIFPATMKEVAFVLQTGAIVLFFAIWGLPEKFRAGARWYWLLPLLLGFGTIANPRWRNGVSELTERTFLHSKAVTALQKIVPDNAIVFGERAPQLFLSLKSRVAPVPNGDPVPMALNIHKKYPAIPLFALLDAEHNYHFTHYDKNKDKIQLQVLHTLVLPSFNTSLPSNVFLVRLLFKDTPVTNGPFRQ